jgi:GAF domain-containing protein
MKEKANDLLTYLDNLLNDDSFEMSVLANASALLKEMTVDVNWLGFYILKNDNLYLGPFQGRVACNLIALGKGVCGRSALNKKTLIVSDVSSVLDYIACDSDTKSEIVVPIIIHNQVYGVLDIDSASLNRFSETDALLFERAAAIIAKHLAKFQ